MGRPAQWDRRAWVISGHGEPSTTIETAGGETWALRALISAGPEGLRPTDGATNRFGFLIERLRALGVRIDDLPPDEAERPGFRLACAITSAGSR
jgi:hypothetical protein